MIRNLLCAFGIFIVVFAVYLFIVIPSDKKIKGCLKTSFYGVELCPGSKSYVPLKNISPLLQKAIISTEDGKFYQHNGFDTDGIEHCLEKIKEKKSLVCGGSTITQQLAKNMFLSKSKTFFRKGIEALITMRIEEALTKKEILERYLNVVQFGKNVFGVKQAAQHYFKKSPSQLNEVESAFLAMVLPNPEKYSVSYYRKDLTKFARRRIKTIIQNMYSFKMISEDSYYNGVGQIDSFLSQGHKKDSPEKHTEVLSKEDLEEMTIIPETEPAPKLDAIEPLPEIHQEAPIPAQEEFLETPSVEEPQTDI